MEAGVSIARKARAEHRHDLRTLTYLTVNHVNAGVIRNLTQSGFGAQLVKRLGPGEQVRLHFELRNPKLRIETLGEVVWSSSAGACGIRFLELSRAMRQQINAWIFGDLLESVSLHAVQSGEMFSGQLFGKPNLDDSNGEDESDSAESVRRAEELDGLMLSGGAAKVIQLPLRPVQFAADSGITESADETVSLDWLSQPLSPGAIARLIDCLAVIAAFVLFAFVFLSITGDAPPWPFTMAGLGIVLVAVVYRGFFWVFGGKSLGTRVARTSGLHGSSVGKRRD